MSLLNLLLHLQILVATIISSTAFQTLNQQLVVDQRNSITQLRSTTPLVSLERTAQRQIEQFQGWAGSCGVQAENGFCLQGQMVDGVEDYFAATSTGAAKGSRVLYVPGEMIISSSLIAQEYEGYVDASLQILAEMNMQHLHKHFHLFLKLLVEYERGSESPYIPWFEALPRKWNTAVSMGKTRQLARAWVYETETHTFQPMMQITFVSRAFLHSSSLFVKSREIN
jgi:hypothetical protein